MNSGEELVDYLAGLHESAIVPDVLLIDDLHYYITQLKVKMYFLRLIGRSLQALVYCSFKQPDSPINLPTIVKGHPPTYQVAKRWGRQPIIWPIFS